MFRRSTATPTRAAARAARAAVLTASGTLVLASCSAGWPWDGGQGTPAKPVRVESREEALTRATRIQDHVRELTGLERDLWIKIVSYEKCPGRGLGIAEQGEPYRLTSVVQLKAADDRHAEVLRALRERLAGEGFTITSPEPGRAAPSTPPSEEFVAAHGPDPYTVSLLDGTKPGQGVGVAVTLPCQAPPADAASPTPTATAPTATA
ncbi:hypothetical protein ATKI12_8922 [Kitasatospora sp. Ki12]